MDVRVVIELTSPGVQHGDKTEPGSAEELGISSKRLECLGGGLKHRRVAEPLM